MAFRQVYHQRYDEADRYKGEAEVLKAELRGPPEQALPASVAGQIIGNLAVHVAGNGGTPLVATVWADTSPTWHTLYKVEYVVHAGLAQGQASGSEMQLAFLPALPWGLIIVAVSAAIVALGIAFTAWQVSKQPWGGAAIAGGIGLGIVLLGALILSQFKARE